MKIELIAIVPTGGAAETLTLGFENPGPVGPFLSELFRVVPIRSAVALAVDGQPVDWHRGADGRVVIREPLTHGALAP